MITRRTVLKFGLGGAAALAVSAAVPLPALAGPPSGDLQVLSARELQVLEAIAERVAPGGDGFPPASELGVAALIDQTLVQLDPGDAEDLRSAIRLFDSPLTLLLVSGSARAFTRLSAAEQDAFLESWRTGSDLQRKVFKAVHGLCATAYWSNPRIYEGVGYPGPPDFKNFVPAAEQ